MPMETAETDFEDILRPHYDLRQMRLRRVGPGYPADHPIRARLAEQNARFAKTEAAPPEPVSVTLAPDVAPRFPTSDAVNEALRLVLRLSELPAPAPV